MAEKSKVVKLDFTKRETTGTGVCRKIRVKGQVPVVLYGPDYKEGLAGIVEQRAVAAVTASARRDTTLIELKMSDGTIANALIRDVQRHPLSRQLRHIDFYQVLEGHKVKVEIPVRLVNADKAKGVKDGGVLTQATRSLEVEVQPAEIPDEFTYDAAAADLGAEVFVKDLDIPEGIDVLTDAEALVFHIAEPKFYEESAEEGTAEVEVVAKGKAAKGEE